MQCPDEHAFCSTCIHHFLATQGSECPECKVALSVERLTPWSRVLRNLLGELRIRCAFAADGCNETLALSSITSHEQSCPHGHRTCRHCRQVLERRERGKKKKTKNKKEDAEEEQSALWDKSARKVAKWPLIADC